MKLLINKQSKRANRVDAITPEIKALGRDLLEFAKSQVSPQALGVASTQVFNGDELMTERMCVVNVTHDYKIPPKWIIAINPELVRSAGTKGECRETCLSWPDKYVVADRYPLVLIRFQDEEGKSQTGSYTGLDAEIWQHELGHLDGTEEVLIEAAGNKGCVMRRAAYAMKDPIVNKVERLKPNQICTCGSGIKYKKCCGRR